MKLLGYVTSVGTVAGSIAIAVTPSCSSHDSSSFDGGFGDVVTEDSWRVYDAQPDGDGGMQDSATETGEDAAVEAEAGQPDVVEDTKVVDVSADVSSDASNTDASDASKLDVQTDSQADAGLQCEAGTNWIDYKDQACLSCDVAASLKCAVMSSMVFDEDCGTVTIYLNPGQIQITNITNVAGGFISSGGDCSSPTVFDDTMWDATINEDVITIQLKGDAASATQLCYATIMPQDACGQSTTGWEINLYPTDGGGSVLGAPGSATGTPDASCGVNLWPLGCIDPY